MSDHVKTSKPGSRRISSCQCWPIMFSGTCCRPGRHSPSLTKSITRQNAGKSRGASPAFKVGARKSSKAQARRWLAGHELHQIAQPYGDHRAQYRQARRRAGAKRPSPSPQGQRPPSKRRSICSALLPCRQSPHIRFKDNQLKHRKVMLSKSGNFRLGNVRGWG